MFSAHHNYHYRHKMPPGGVKRVKMSSRPSREPTLKGDDQVLDSTMFPDLMDLICTSVTDYGTLMALRSVDRRRRTLAEPLLGRHLYMCQPTFEDPASAKVEKDLREMVHISAHDGRIPVFAEWQEIELGFGAYDREPEADQVDVTILNKPWIQPKAIKHTTKTSHPMLDDVVWYTRLICCLRATRVIDLVGIVLEWRFDEVLSYLKHPITLRFVPDHNGKDPWAIRSMGDMDFDADAEVIKEARLTELYANYVQSVVTFQHLNGPRRLLHDDRDEPLWPIMDGEGSSPRRMAAISAHRMVHTYFFQSRGDMDEPESANMTKEYIAERVFMFIRQGPVHRFRLREVTSAVAETDPLRQGLPHLAGLLSGLFADIAAYLPLAKVTLVNVFSLNPEVFFMHPEASEEEVTAEVLRAIKEAIQMKTEDEDEDFLQSLPDGSTMDERVEMVMKNLQVISLDEYRASVPPDQFKLETEE